MKAASVQNPCQASKPAAAHIDDILAENIPEELRNANRWLVWKWEWLPPAGKKKGKWDKPPIEPATGIEWDATDPVNWMTFRDSRAQSPRHGSGSGFQLGSENDPSGHVVLDIDHCIDDQGNISPAALDLVKRFNSYTERTPSGKGLRIWLRGKKPGDRCRCPSHPDKFLATVEVYSHGRYLTVTGRHLEGTPTAIASRESALNDLYGAMFGQPANHQGNGQAPAHGHLDLSDDALIEKARKSRHGDEFIALFEQGDLSRHGNDHSSADLALMNRFAFWTVCDMDRMERLFSLSALGQRDKWKDRADYRARTIDKAIRDCTATYQPRFKGALLTWPPAVSVNGHAGPKNSGTQPDVNEAIDDPHRLARIYGKNQCTHNGIKTLVYHRGEFHKWEESAYRPVPEGEIIRSLNLVCKSEFDRLNRIAVKKWEDGGKLDKNGKACDPPQAHKVGTRLIGDINQALGGMALLSGRVDPPAWLIDNPPFPAADVLPTSNALVHLPSLVEGKPGAVQAPTPAFFCPYALDYAFDANAPDPLEWINFLLSVWPKDGESFMALQEWLGYLLTLDTRQQKIGVFIGPTRSGRGTISRVIRGLIGPDNVASPTLSGLASHFGAACLIGKPVAIIGDARQSHRSDWAVALERLLMISGEDAIEIDRKNKPAWAGKLPTRIMMISNELPKFPDQSGALAGRFLLFRFTETFLGREDKALDAKLQAELPGILLWAIEGWKRLRQRGHFLQPKTGLDLIDQMRDMSSPVGAFVRERCKIGPGYRGKVPDVFAAWKDWCITRNREPGEEGTFGRNLRTVLPNLVTKQSKQGGTHVRYFEGLKVKSVPIY